MLVKSIKESLEFIKAVARTKYALYLAMTVMLIIVTDIAVYYFRSPIEEWPNSIENLLLVVSTSLSVFQMSIIIFAVNEYLHGDSAYGSNYKEAINKSYRSFFRLFLVVCLVLVNILIGLLLILIPGLFLLIYGIFAQQIYLLEDNKRVLAIFRRGKQLAHSKGNFSQIFLLLLLLFFPLFMFDIAIIESLAFRLYFSLYGSFFSVVATFMYFAIVKKERVAAYVAANAVPQQS